MILFEVVLLGIGLQINIFDGTEYGKATCLICVNAGFKTNNSKIARFLTFGLELWHFTGWGIYYNNDIKFREKLRYYKPSIFIQGFNKKFRMEKKQNDPGIIKQR